tara:strand:- start:11 stop:517 length:507 start_codon:yes stop_codon:yes gene_type:complete
MISPISLEQKFLLVMSYYQNEDHQIWLKGSDGLIKLESRPTWVDGLNSLSSIRIINQNLGASYAPRDWSHVVRLLKLYKVDLESFEEALDYRINMRIIHNYNSLIELYNIFEKEYVDSIIKSKGQDATSSVKSWYDKFFKKAKLLSKETSSKSKGSKPNLTVIKGDKE